MHAAFAFEQLAVVQPNCPVHDQVRVVQQAVAPLSQDAVPAVHAPAVVEHAQLTEALQVEVPLSHPYPDEHLYRHAVVLAVALYAVVVPAGDHAEPFHVWRYDETVFQSVPVAGFAVQV